MRILIADDEKDIRIVFKAIICREFSDSHVDAVANGAEAVDTFQNGTYDVVLMDLYMPVKDGYGAYLEIQEICRKENRKMPFMIFCTGYSAPEEIVEIAVDKTRYALLQKPMNCEMLINTIKALK